MCTLSLSLSVLMCMSFLLPPHLPSFFPSPHPVFLLILHLPSPPPDSSSRLHQSVERILDQLTDTHRQLIDSQRTQRELTVTVEANTADNEELRQRVEDLEAQLTQEIEAKEYLAVELNKTEGKSFMPHPVLLF